MADALAHARHRATMRELEERGTSATDERAVAWFIILGSLMVAGAAILVL